MMNKAIKYRIYPSKEQYVLFVKTFGCCRKVWNLMLSDKIEGYRSSGKFPMVTPAMYKHDRLYLKEVDSLALANVQLNLQSAFRNCFSKSRKCRNAFPKFKSKHKNRRSYTTNNQNGTVAIKNNRYIRLPKVGLVKAVIHRIPEDGWVIKSATVSQDGDGKFYVSVLFEFEQPAVTHAVDKHNAVGLDYKSGGLYVDSNGSCPEMPGYYRLSEKHLAHLQRKLSKCEKGSSNRKKHCKKVAKLSRHVANQRKDFLHKLSTGIANRYGIVCVEDLNMRSMANKGFGNGKATLDNGYGMFLNMLEYKLQDHGGVLVKVDKWFPSSQLCSCCGTRVPSVKDLSIRKWICPCCGTEHDRDVNAAKNILAEGLRILAV